MLFRSRPASLTVTTMTSKDQEVKCSVYSDLVVRGYKSADRIEVAEACSRDSIPLDWSHIPTPDIARSWNHLRPIAHEIPELLTCEVGILIGYDTSRALIPLRSIAGSGSNEPFAVETPLGWSIVGKVGSKGSGMGRTCNRVITLQNEHSLTSHDKAVSSLCKSVEPQPSAVLDLLQQDFKDAKNHSTQTMSQDDKQFVDMLTEGIRQREDAHYSMPLPFKTRPKLPNNRDMAEKRLRLLKSKLQSDIC